MRFTVFFAVLLFSAQPSFGYDPRQWMERCLEYASTVDINVNTVETECLTSPIDVCLFSENATECQASYSSFLDEKASELRAALPEAISGSGFTPRGINGMLERIQKDEYDLCTPDYIKGVEVRSKLFPNSLSTEENCRVLNKAYSIIEMMMVRRRIDRFEAKQ